MVARGDTLKLWTDEEDEAIRRLYPRALLPEILAALPRRSQSAITSRAAVLGVRCEARRHLGKVVAPVIVRDGVRGRACVACLEWKPLEKFSRHKTAAEGRRNRCTTCEGRLAYKRNRARCIAQAKKWQRLHPEQARQIKHAGTARRRARMLGLDGEHVSSAQVEQLFESYDYHCAYCKVMVADTIDHVVPLVRGGRHEYANLLPACIRCNMDKGTLLLNEWADKIERRAAEG